MVLLVPKTRNLLANKTTNHDKTLMKTCAGKEHCSFSQTPRYDPLRAALVPVETKHVVYYDNGWFPLISQHLKHGTGKHTCGRLLFWDTLGGDPTNEMRDICRIGLGFLFWS